MCVIPGSEHDKAEHRRIDALTAEMQHGEATPTLLFARGHAHKQLGHLDAALDDLTRVSNINGVERSLRGRTQHFRAICLRRLGVVGEALVAADDAVALDPKSPSTWGHRGYVRSVAGDHSGALGDYDRSMSIEPDSATSYIFRGNGWVWNGDYAKALADYDHVIDRFGADSAYNVFHNRGVARLLYSDQTGARADFNLAERMRPTDPFRPFDPRPLACRGLLNVLEGDLAAADQDLHASSHLGFDAVGVVAWALLESKSGNPTELVALGHAFATDYHEGAVAGLRAFAKAVDTPLSLLAQLQPIIG